MERKLWMPQPTYHGSLRPRWLPFAILGLCLVLVLSAMALHPSATSTTTQTRLTPAVTTYDNWAGYEGNAVIYPTLDQHNIPLPVLAPTRMWVNSTNDTYSGTQYSFADENALALAISTNSSSLPYFINTGGTDNDFVAYIWFSAAAAAQQYYSGSATNQYDVLPYLLELGASGPTLPTSANLQFEYGGANVAVNLTKPATPNASSQELNEMIAAMDTLAAFIPDDYPALISALSAAGIINDYGALLSTSSSGPSCATSYPPGNSICQYGLVTGGQTSSLGSTTLGSNTFSQATGIELLIPGDELSSVTPGMINLSATDQISWDHYWCVNHNCFNTGGDVTGLATSGATDLSYSIAPAVGIGGYIDLYPGPGAPAAGGAQITLYQTCNGINNFDFIVTANAAGYWHFFGKPGCSYSYSVSYSGYWYDYPVSFTRTGSFAAGVTTVEGADSENLNITLWGGAVSFVETGLPEFTSWSATLNGNTESSGGGTTVSFLMANGSYPFSIGSVTCYSSSASIGSPITVSGSAVTDDVTFTQTCSYSVTISETGLPSGDTWTGGVGSSSKSTSGTSLTFSGLAGTNSWVVDIYIVSEKCTSTECTIDEYVPSPAAGSVSGATTIKVTFTYEAKIVKID